MNTDLLISATAFVVLGLLWLAFAGALAFHREVLDAAWHRFRGWPLLIQLAVALLVLPVVMGLWVWETRWPAWLRLALVAGLAWGTLYTFFPRLLFV
jgi:hypothetical protein